MIKHKYYMVIIWSVVIGLAIGWATNGPTDSPPKPKVSTQKITHRWTRADSLSFTLDQLQAEADRQFACLQNLWGKESGWDPKAKNLDKSQGLNAGGIPQLLGLNPLTPPTEQIRRGLRYITYRYITPCIAWQHWERNGWY